MAPELAGRVPAAPGDGPRITSMISRHRDRGRAQRSGARRGMTTTVGALHHDRADHCARGGGQFVCDESSTSSLLGGATTGATGMLPEGVAVVGAADAVGSAPNCFSR